jgi:hypothetical protein
MFVFHQKKLLDMILKFVHQNEAVIKVWSFLNQDHGLLSMFELIRRKKILQFYLNRDIDSDGDEIPALEPDDPTDFQYSLWFTVDINVEPPDAQATVDLTAPCLVCLFRYDVCLAV